MFCFGNLSSAFVLFSLFVLCSATNGEGPSSVSTNPIPGIETWESGTNSSVSGISATFVGLDSSAHNYFLTVEVYETDFNGASEYVDLISAGSSTLSTYCNPNVQDGSQYYTCESGRDVTGDIAFGSLDVVTTATSDVDCCGYNGFSLYVKYTLSTSPPLSIMPSQMPSVMPSGMPTQVQTSQEVWEGGTNSPVSGIAVTFVGLNTAMYRYALTVEVRATDYLSSNEYVDLISAGPVTLSSFCNPGVDSGQFFYLCESDRSVNVSSSGSLTVLTTATSDINCCAYNGYYLYVRYTLTKTPLVPIPAPQVWEGGTNFPPGGISFNFSGLDSSVYSYYLSVEVYATDFQSSSEYVNLISAESVALSSYCNPGVDSGGYFYSCLSGTDVTGLVNQGSVEVLTTGTIDINCCSHGGFYLYARYTLSVTPPGTPSASIVPTIAPTIVPPTITPTIAPSPVSYNSLTWEGGTNSVEDGLHWYFTGLNTGAYRYSLTVEVYNTDFDLTSEYVDLISAGGTTLSTFCSPDVTGYNTCVSERDVTGDISLGALMVYATATGDVNVNGYNGYAFYARYTLSISGLRETVWEGGTNSPTVGAAHTFTSLNTTMYTYHLTVEVYETDFADPNEYVDRISAGSAVLSSNCNPGVDSGGRYYTCVSRNVTGYISSGSLAVVTSATSSVNCCRYNGHYLSVKYTLTSTDVIAPPPAPEVWVGGTNSAMSGVSHIFGGWGRQGTVDDDDVAVSALLDISEYNYFLTVEVYETDFNAASEYVDLISAGSSTLSTYCNPNVQDGSQYFTCESGRDVTGDIVSGSLDVVTTATSDVDCCGYNTSILSVRYTLTAVRKEITDEGVVTWEGGTNTPATGISSTFYGLDSTVYDYSLTMEVYETNFAQSSEYVVGVTAGSSDLLSRCDPNIDQGGKFYVCLVNVDVTRDVSLGSLRVTSSATSSVDSYPHLGYAYYVRYTLAKTLAATGGLVEWEGGTNSPSSGIHHNFGGIDTSRYNYFLTVDVYATDFDSSNEYITSVSSNSVTLTGYCNPGVNYGGYRACVSGRDISQYISYNSYGYFDVHAYATDSVDSNTYRSYSFYAKFSLQATSVNSTEDDDSGEFVLITVLCVTFIFVGGIVLALCCKARRKNAWEARSSTAQSGTYPGEVELLPSPSAPSRSVLEHDMKEHQMQEEDSAVFLGSLVRSEDSSSLAAYKQGIMLGADHEFAEPVAQVLQTQPTSEPSQVTTLSTTDFVPLSISEQHYPQFEGDVMSHYTHSHSTPAASAPRPPPPSYSDHV